MASLFIYFCALPSILHHILQAHLIDLFAFNHVIVSEDALVYPVSLVAP